MRIEDLYESLLMEGISPIVYHSTQTSMLMSILSQNELRLAPVFAKPSEASMPTPKMYFLSTARTRTGKYHQGRHHSALIKLDGRMLSNNLKGMAVDYWGPDYRGFSNGAYEEEDRIFSNHDSIKDIVKFILGIDLVDDLKNPRDIRKLAIFCKARGIPFRVFNTPRDMVAQQNEVDLSSIIDAPSGKQPEKYYRNIRRPNPDGYKEGIIGLFAALKFSPEDRHKLSSGMEKQLDDFLMNLKYRNLSGIGADLHMSQNSPDHRNMMFEISKMLRKYNVTNWKDMVPMLEQKWGIR